MKMVSNDIVISLCRLQRGVVYSRGMGRKVSDSLTFCWDVGWRVTDQKMSHVQC